MLLASWRHTRRRVQTQQALVAETNFRRAMENSMSTGMRVLDMEGRIAYVNPAFCRMIGWNEADLIGRSPPFPYWVPGRHETTDLRLDNCVLPPGIGVDAANERAADRAEMPGGQTLGDMWSQTAPDQDAIPSGDQ